MSQICSGRIQQLWAIPILLVAVWIRCFPSPIRVHNTQIPRFLAKVEQDILQWKIGKIVNIIQVEQLKAGTGGEWEKWSNSAMEVRGTGKRNSLIEPGNKKGKKGRWKWAPAVPGKQNLGPIQQEKTKRKQDAEGFGHLTSRSYFRLLFGCTSKHPPWKRSTAPANTKIKGLEGV